MKTQHGHNSEQHYYTLRPESQATLRKTTTSTKRNNRFYSNFNCGLPWHFCQRTSKIVRFHHAVQELWSVKSHRGLCTKSQTSKASGWASFGNQYLVYPPLDIKHAALRRLMDMLNLLRTAWGMAFHSCCNKAKSCGNPCGGGWLSWTCLSR